MLAVDLRRITKHFGALKANDDVSVAVTEGTIHALVGENGAGKSTLMKVLYGMVQPDSGTIAIRERALTLRTPAQAIAHHIGMVHQHFMLLPTQSVTENVILGSEPTRGLGMLDLEQAHRSIRDLSERYRLPIDPRATVQQLSVGLQQRVEILKLLYRDAEILILDEPTPVLTPQEIADFFSTLREMRSQGKTVILISHKLSEVMSISDEVTVMRNGRVVQSLPTSSTNEVELSRLMVGKDILPDSVRTITRSAGAAISVDNVTLLRDRTTPALKGISFSVARGEIFGIAGVEGNGQAELAQVLSGLRKQTSGTISLCGSPMNDRTVIGHIPDDRIRQGIILDFTISENLILGRQRDAEFYGRFSMKERAVNSHADAVIHQFDIRLRSKDQRIRELSGGNQQKVVIARELSKRAPFIIANQPTRGLDIGAIDFVHASLMSERNKGTGVLLISSDLGELLKLADRIAVMYGGEIVAVVDGRSASEQELGMYMTGSGRQSA